MAAYCTCMSLPSVYEFINDEKDGLHMVQQTALLHVTPGKEKYRQQKRNG